MTFAAPSWVTDAGVIFGALIAFTTFMGMLAKSRFGRWLASQVAVSAEHWVERISREAATHALDSHVAQLDAEVENRLDEILPRHLQPVLYELRSNGGGSFRDQVITELKELQLRHDRVAIFMDNSTMDRHELREMFENQIARTALAEQGDVDDREEEPQ